MKYLFSITLPLSNQTPAESCHLSHAAPHTDTAHRYSCVETDRLYVAALCAEIVKIHNMAGSWFSVLLLT